MREVRAAFLAHGVAKEKLHHAIKTYFTAGRSVTWLMSGHLQIGYVLDVSCDQIKVHNVRTGKERWLGVYWFVEAAP